MAPATCVTALKDLLDPKSFNPVSYIAVVLWNPLSLCLFGVNIAIAKAKESEFFHCRIRSKSQDSVQKLCYDRYRDEYPRRPYYLLGFWISNWFCISVVCWVYSQCVKLRFECPADPKVDIENPRRIQRRASSRWLYGAYCCQLTARLVFHILFIILQTTVLYPQNFPAITYNCTLNESHANVTSSVEQYVTQTNPTQTHQCGNPTATADVIVCLVNGLLVVCVLIEMIYILSRAKITNSFKLDFYFFQTHIMGKSTNPLEVQSHREELRRLIHCNEGELIDSLMSPNSGEENELYDDLEHDFDTVYTKLVICPDRVQYQFTGKERHEILEGYVKSKFSQRPIDKLEDIFTDLDTRGKIIRTIMIVGRPGIGKSTLCKKIIRDIANGKMSSKTTDVFLYEFRDYNKTEENLNLQQWLSSSVYPCELSDNAFGSICNSPDKVICIFDGLDEFRYKSHIIDAKSIHSDDMPFSAFYEKLVSGQLFAGATIITTSRTNIALTSVAHIMFDRTLEILGFAPEQVEEYVKNVVSTSDIAEQIWQHINRNANLLSLCYIPVNCFIICISLLYSIQHTASVSSLPVTLTEICRRVLKVFICNHNSEYRDNTSEKNELLNGSGNFMPTVKDSLITLGQLALKGTSEQRLIFESSEVKGLEQCCFLHRLPGRHTGPFKTEAQFCFIHLIIQEFLSSWYMVQTKNDEELAEFVTHATVTEGKWQVVVQFVAGLLHDCAETMVTMFTDLLPDTGIEQHGLTVWPRCEDKELVLVLFRCIFEIAAGSSQIYCRRLASAVSEKMHFGGVDISKMSLIDADIVAVVFVLQEVKTISFIDFSLNFIGPTGCFDICKLLINKECAITTLNISANQITDEGAMYLSSALCKDECKLTTLNISANQITDKGTMYLSDALSEDKCKLTTLNISANQITDKGAMYLSEALSEDKCKLTTLNIGANQITDVGIEHLFKTFSKDEFKYINLGIRDDIITVEGEKHLSN